MHAAHRPRRDEDELLADGVSRGFDLQGRRSAPYILQLGPRGGLSSTIFRMLTSRLTLSIKTSLVICQRMLNQGRSFPDTHNSSRHRTGAPMASHNDSRRQIVENDFSPPDNVFASRPLPTLVASGSTCKSSFFSLWLASRRPRKLRSLSIHMNWTRALAVMALWNDFQRSLRLTKVDLSNCTLHQ